MNGNGTYDSPAFTPTAPGTYRWIAAYSGDNVNGAVAGACNDPNETSVVSASPDFQITAVKRNEKKGTAKLTIEFNMDGALRIDRTNKVAQTEPEPVVGPGTEKLKVEARSKAEKRLERRGKVTVNPRALYAADGEELGERLKQASKD